ncbi:MAG TPA: phosphatase PAP2 family protein [Candidatus Sulfotelmatobacter sp.]|jgi:membrane-associated phospholipid phosphatase|nr:phosphatase PAP2 family protein [Candidatus Sulfotelmatobacter sp.]
MIRAELLFELVNEFCSWVVRLTRRWPLAAWGVHCLLFALISFAVIDKPLAIWFKTHLADTKYEGFFRTVTDIGLGGLWLIPSALGWMFCRWRLWRADYFDVAARYRRWSDSLLYFFLTVVLSGLFVNAVKFVIGRYRPRAWFDQGLYGLHPFSTDWAINSFPSGHSQTIFSAMMALAVIVPRYHRAWLLLGALVAFSRVALSVHYLGDVVMGSYIGVVAAVLMNRAFAAKGIEVKL